MDETASQILGPKTGLIKPTAEIEDSFGGNSYGPFHRMNRQMWRHATARLIGRTRIREICYSSAKQMCDVIEKECSKCPDGIDPRDIFALGPKGFEK